ncbi:MULTISPECIES: glycosyltransferase [Metallosphaera]|uniref:glycosyltransferase n=2 Tax=Sulfolobaceae TaxID=118883 RepID=UPI001F06D387|nr:glycosyltransferase [Metallosphaera sedula]MCH1771433.1 glycosyltransferase [Metallosphaera sedula]MCP6729825.1 glycosyltransferase [Metallosphaera sedula]
MKSTLVIHRVTRSVSGEGNVVRASAELLKEKKVDTTLATFSPPLDDLGLPYMSVVPFKLRLFDKYQRAFTYISARKTRPDFFLNITAIPIPLSDIAKHIIYGVAPEFSSVPSKYNSSLVWKLYILPLRGLLKRFREEAQRSVFIANSRYSSKAIREIYGVDSEVVYPPVDVTDFLKAYHEEGEPYFLTIGRFEPGKRLDLAVRLSAMTGIRGVIVGSMESDSYLKRLIKLSKELKADVQFLPNVKREYLIEVMKRASIYFHPTLGEHFGIPIVEAMAAGLVPIVPRESGGFEIVPEFSYDSLEEASELVKSNLKAPSSVRRDLREKALGFDRRIFKERMWSVIERAIT